jgi:acetyltransferase
MRMCFNDYDREMAIVAEYHDPKTGEAQIAGVGRLSEEHGFNEAEFALIVSDQWQNRGLGSELLQTLVQIGRDEKVSRIWAHILPDNHDMIHVCKKVGFTIAHDNESKECVAEIKL